METDRNLSAPETGADSVKRELHTVHIEGRSLRLAAAGLAGALVLANTPQAAAGMQDPTGTADRTHTTVSLAGDPDRTRTAGSLTGARDRTHTTVSLAGDPDREQIVSFLSETDHLGENTGSGETDLSEEAVLERWKLDAEELPPEEEEEAAPYVPEDLLPYFQEWTSPAVNSYGEDLPPQPHLEKYSPRMDALKNLVRRTAEGALDQQKKRILKGLKGIASEAGPSFCSGLLASLQGEGVPAQTAEGEGNSTAGGSGRQRGEIPFLTGKKKEDSPSSIEGFLKTRPSRGSGGEETEGHSTPEDPAADNPFFRVMETQTPEQQAKLPVPPMLYDFTIRFPAGRISMAQETGQKLFPGFANYGFYEPVPDKVDTDHTEMIPASNRKEETGAEEKAEKDRTHSRTKGREAEEEPATGEEKSRRLVLIGDSRTVGMQMTVPTEGEVYWSAANSMGYSWMVSTGVPAVDDLIGEDTDVAILMGVNDLGNVGKYAQYINEKAAEWKARGARTFFVSVTPVDDSRSPNAKNARIESFNAYMQENLQDAVYIDAYNRIRNTYRSPDGIHYASSTYQEIYRIIRYYAFRGWYEEAGLWFYFDSGRPRTGWQYLDGSWQYFDGNGVRWIRDGWVGDMWIAPYPEIGMVNPYDAVRH